MHLNRKAVSYLSSGFVVSLIGLFLIWSYDSLYGIAVLFGSVLFPVGIFLFSKVPDDGVFGRWIVPGYALLWSYLNWVALHLAWDRVGPPESDGWGAAGTVVSILFAQVIAHGLTFVSKEQRVLKFRLAIGMALLYPYGLVYMYMHRM